jgi:hypothetical protein
MVTKPMKQPFPGFTASGAEIDYLRPELTKIVLEDCLLPLSRMGRYAGLIPVTVLEHLALCVELAKYHSLDDVEVALCAAHDLHEAIMVDLPTPLKALLPDYRAIEDRWEAHVHRQLGLPWPRSEKQVKRVHFIDARAAVVEMALYAHPLARRKAERSGGPATVDERCCWVALELSERVVRSALVSV